MRGAAVALRHLCFEDAGLRDSILAQRGFDLRYCDAPIEDTSARDSHDADPLIILGDRSALVKRTATVRRARGEGRSLCYILANI